MTVKILLKDQIRAQILRIFSGYCFWERFPSRPSIHILSPWISNVELELNREVLQLNEEWFGLDYGIISINLPYALLLLKLDFGAKIHIITLPPTEKNYGDGVPWIKNLLDFFDEIGCNTYVNQDLHSKLLLSNDFAILGSFNLSKSALYDREELGVSIDDIGNLKILEQYADSIIDSSTPYGYSVRAEGFRHEGITGKVTRGWLYEELVREYYGLRFLDGKRGRGGGAEGIFDEFFIDHILESKIYYLDEVAKAVAADLDAFYSKAVMKYLSTTNISEEKKLDYLKNRFDFQGKYEIAKVLSFLETKLAREHVPKIPLRILSVKKSKP